MLTPIFYMMNVFDKAVSTGSLSTLAALVSVIAFLYLCLMGFEWVRSIILVHISARLDRLLAPSIYKLCFKSSAGSLDGIELGSQPLSDLNGLRQFLGSQSVTFYFRHCMGAVPIGSDGILQSLSRCRGCDLHGHNGRYCYRK